MKPTFAAVFMFLLAVAVFPQKAIVIKNVGVVDVERGVSRPGLTVVVTGNRVQAIGMKRNVRMPRDAQVLDGSGKFLIPGLWDMHVHVDDAGEWMFPLFIANGVTGVRDMGSTLESVAGWRRMRSAGTLMPDIAAAGPIISGKIGDTDPRMALVADGDEAARTVSTIAAGGADLLKVHDWISRDAYLGLIAEAKRRRIPLAGHQPVSMTSAEISRLGQKSVEHLGNAWGGMMVECSTDEIELRRKAQSLIPLTTPTFDPAKVMSALGPDWNMRLATTFSRTKARRLARTFKRNGTWFDPTIFGFAYAWTFISPAEIFADPRIKYMPLSAQKAAAEAAKESAPAKSPEALETEKLFYRRQLNLVRTMSDAGVGILAGTDSLPFPPLYPGFSLHDELQKLVEAGLSPAAALRAATSNPARYFGRLASTGTIAAGKSADLVLLDADPLSDIRNTQKINAVIVGGRLLDRKALDNLLDGVAARQK